MMVTMGTVLFGIVFVYRNLLDIRLQAAYAACFFLLMVFVVWGVTGLIAWGYGVMVLSYVGTG